MASLLSRRGEFSLQQLFGMEEYPSDLMGFYGQGYSVSRFLVEIGGRPRFLRFVQGRSADRPGTRPRVPHYGLANCRELDRAWRSWYSIARSTRIGRRRFFGHAGTGPVGLGGVSREPAVSTCGRTGLALASTRRRFCGLTVAGHFEWAVEAGLVG